MPGCGKSTAGVILAKTLGLDFLDTDLVIQKREHAVLQKILNVRGLENFLDVEEQAVLSIQCQNTVIATGGSVIYRSAAAEHLKNLGTVVYIRLSYEEMMQRLQNIKTRGIAIPAGLTMKDLYQERIPFYEKYADLVTDGTGKTIEETVTSITHLLKI